MEYRLTFGYKCRFNIYDRARNNRRGWASFREGCTSSRAAALLSKDVKEKYIIRVQWRGR